VFHFKLLIVPIHCNAGIIRVSFDAPLKSDSWYAPKRLAVRKGKFN
jgi:hypothetical protein